MKCRATMSATVGMAFALAGDQHLRVDARFGELGVFGRRREVCRRILTHGRDADSV